MKKTLRHMLIGIIAATAMTACEGTSTRIEPLTANPAVCSSIGEVVYNVYDSICSNSNSHWIQQLNEEFIYVVNSNEELERIAPGQSRYLDLENNTLIITALHLISTDAYYEADLWMDRNDNTFTYVIDVTYPSYYTQEATIDVDCRFYRKINSHITCEYNETFEEDDE